MKQLTKIEQERLAVIFCHMIGTFQDAINGVWDKSDEGFVALRNTAARGLQILGEVEPEYKYPWEDA